MVNALKWLNLYTLAKLESPHMTTGNCILGDTLYDRFPRH